MVGKKMPLFMVKKELFEWIINKRYRTLNSELSVVDEDKKEIIPR